MELSDLTIYCEVVSQGSITKAANKLGYVQSNITSRMQQLENEMSTKLLYRHPRGVTPTAAGKILLEHSERIISLVAEMQRSVKNPQTPTEKLTLGIAQTISLAYHSSIVKHILEVYPSVDMSVTVKHSDDLIVAVENNTLDFALVTGPVHHPDLMELRVAKEEIVLVSHGEEKIEDLFELANYTVLLHESPCAFRKVLEALLAAAKISPPKILEYGTPESLLNGIMEGVGVSLLPLSAVKKYVDSGILHATAVKQSQKTIATVLIFQRGILPSQHFDLLVDVLKTITGNGGEFL